MILKEKPNGMNRADTGAGLANRAAMPTEARDAAIAAEESTKRKYVDRQNCSRPTVYIYRSRAADSHRRAGCILRTPTDIFPNINIPVVSIGWTYTSLSPEELEGRLTTAYEKALTKLVDNIQHIESTTCNGESSVKVYLQPGASLDTASARVTAASRFLLRQLPPGTLPPQIIYFSASSVPILQLGISGERLTETPLRGAEGFEGRVPRVSPSTPLRVYPGLLSIAPPGQGLRSGKIAALHREGRRVEFSSFGLIP
jgi:hypothetical protein